MHEKRSTRIVETSTGVLDQMVSKPTNYPNQPLVTLEQYGFHCYYCYPWFLQEQTTPRQEHQDHSC